MVSQSNGSRANDRAPIVRTERGLTISGTRITLYDIMDYAIAPHQRDRSLRTVGFSTGCGKATVIALLQRSPVVKISVIALY